MKPISVLIADDHLVVRKGLRYLLEPLEDVELAGEAVNGREAVDMAAKLQPTVVIADIAMPVLNGIDATAQIVKQNPKMGVILLSMHFDEGYLLRALSAGAKGYLLKESAEADIPKAVRSVAQGKPFFSPDIAQTLLGDYLRMLKDRRLTDSYELLSAREKEILQLLAEGKTNKDCATLLNVTPNTVETHRLHLMQKLDLHNTAEIVLYAVKKGIIKP
jgi:two-component system, NarL family, response regulator NreC